MENKLLSAKAILPKYDRSKLVSRIVHLGFGAFHRAHQAVYADILANEYGSDWGYCEVNLIGGEQQIADLKKQDNLYSVAEMSADAWHCRVVGVVKDAIHAQVDGLEAVFSALTQPEVAIVSLTVTEKRLLPYSSYRHHLAGPSFNRARSRSSTAAKICTGCDCRSTGSP